MAEKKQESGFTVTDRRLFTERASCGAKCRRKKSRSRKRSRGSNKLRLLTRQRIAAPEARAASAADSAEREIRLRLGR